MKTISTLISAKHDSLIIIASIVDIIGDVFTYFFLKSFILPDPLSLIQKIICQYRILDIAFQMHSHPLVEIYRMLIIIYKQKLTSWSFIVSDNQSISRRCII